MMKQIFKAVLWMMVCAQVLLAITGCMHRPLTVHVHGPVETVIDGNRASIFVPSTSKDDLPHEVTSSSSAWGLFGPSIGEHFGGCTYEFTLTHVHSSVGIPIFDEAFDPVKLSVPGWHRNPNTPYFSFGDFPVPERIDRIPDDQHPNQHPNQFPDWIYVAFEADRSKSYRVPLTQVFRYTDGKRARLVRTTKCNGAVDRVESVRPLECKSLNIDKQPDYLQDELRSCVAKNGLVLFLGFGLNAELSRYNQLVSNVMKPKQKIDFVADAEQLGIDHAIGFYGAMLADAFGTEDQIPQGKRRVPAPKPHPTPQDGVGFATENCNSTPLIIVK